MDIKFDEIICIIKQLFDKVIEKSKIIKIHNSIKKIYSTDHLFCKNYWFLHNIYWYLLSNKKYIIIKGGGGYGKTTALKAIAECESVNNQFLFHKIVNYKNFYERIRLFNNNRNEILIIDNFDILTETQKDYFVNISCYNKFIFVCREFEFSILKNNSYHLIDCNKYSYRVRDLQRIIQSLNNKNKNYNKEISQLFKKFPQYGKNPFIAKVLASVWNNSNDQIKKRAIINNINDLLNKDIEDEKEWIFLFIDLLMGFKELNNNLLNRLFDIIILTNDSNFNKVHLEDILKGTNIFDKKTKDFCEQHNIIISTSNNESYIHSIFVDFFKNKFHELNENEKSLFFNSENFQKILEKLNDSLEMGIAMPFNEKVQNLTYAHNIWVFCKEYITPDLNGLNLSLLSVSLIKKYIELLNSYTFMLVKMHNNFYELIEAENVQEQIIALMKRIKPDKFSELSDDYLTTLSRYYNIDAKIKLALAIHQQSYLDQTYRRLFKNIKIDLENFYNCTESIKNIALKNEREEIYWYTKALYNYKYSLYISNAYEKMQVLQTSMDAILLSEQIRLNIIKSKDYNTYEKITYCLKNKDYSQFNNLQRDLQMNYKLTEDIQSLCATWALKNIIKTLLYINKNNYIGIDISDSSKSIIKEITFVYNIFIFDGMRRREILILKEFFQNYCTGKNSGMIELHNQDYLPENYNDMRYNLLILLLRVLTSEENIDSSDCIQVYQSYDINKSLLRNKKDNYTELIKILYNYLTM